MITDVAALRTRYRDPHPMALKNAVPTVDEEAGRSSRPAKA